MRAYENGPGNVPRLPERVVDCLIDSAGVSRCAPGRMPITVSDQSAAVERLVHDACEELLARLPAELVDAAARYYWLRDQACGFDQVGTFTPYVIQGQTNQPLGGAALDRAVDAAREGRNG